MACADHPKHHQGRQPQSGTFKSSSTPAKNLKMSSIFEGVLDALNLSDFNQILNIAPSIMSLIFEGFLEPFQTYQTQPNPNFIDL